MTKKIFLSLALALSFVAVRAHAQTNTTIQQERTDHRAAMQQDRTTHKDDIQTLRDSLKGETPEQRAATLKQIQDTQAQFKNQIKTDQTTFHNDIQKQIGDRITAAENRVAELITRLQSRTDKVKTAGKDTTAAQADIDAATKALGDAKTAASALTLGSATDATTLKANNDALKGVRTLLETATKDMKLALTELKKVMPKQMLTETDTSTSTTSTTNHQ